MAESESNCVIVLSTGKTIESSDTVEDVQNHFSRGGEPLRSVTDTKGDTHWVNIAHVVHLHERGDRSPYMP
jgi:hypothetical protein